VVTEDDADKIWWLGDDGWLSWVGPKTLDSNRKSNNTRRLKFKVENHEFLQFMNTLCSEWLDVS
jgi:hypothetical protein